MVLALVRLSISSMYKPEKCRPKTPRSVACASANDSIRTLEIHSLCCRANAVVSTEVRLAGFQ